MAEAADSAEVEPPGVGETMHAKDFFTAEEKERIRQAVVAAEQKTSGEIVPMIVRSSSRYAEMELGGIIVGMLLGTLYAVFWTDPWGALQMPFAWPLVGACLGFLLCRIPSIKRRLISQRRMAEAVHLRSLVAFMAQGLHHTRAHTGILIMASLLEHRVAVLADRGINEKVSPGTWDEVVNILTSGLKSGDASAAFGAAIERCGAILAANFPRPADDRDELENRLVTER